MLEGGAKNMAEGIGLELLHHEVLQLERRLDEKRAELANGTQKYLAKIQSAMTRKDALFLQRLLTEKTDVRAVSRNIGAFKQRERVPRVRLIRNGELAKELKITPGAVSQRINGFKRRNPKAWDFVEMQRRLYMEAWKARNEAAYTGGESANMVNERRAVADFEREKMMLRHSSD